MRRFRRLVAGAIKTTVGAAGSTILGKRVAQVLPSAMQPHGKIVFSDAEFRCHFSELLPLKVDLLQKFAVLFRHHGQEAFEALAESPLVRGTRRLGKFLLEPFKSTTASALTAVDIDNRPPQDAIEPLGGCFLAFRFTVRRESFQLAFLHNVFGEVGVAETIARESHEDFQILHQRRFEAAHW